jgi:integrase
MNIVYLSNFAESIIDYIQEKKALGYKYELQSQILQRFDNFCRVNFPHETILNQKIMLSWSTQLPGENASTLKMRINNVRLLAKYIVRMGHQAYILPNNYGPKTSKYEPYIYTKEELKNFFIQTEQCHYSSIVPYRHHVIPVFFRLLYCTGMRLSEARLLKVEDVELTYGVITVKYAKHDKHRLIPVSDDMLERLKIYYQNVHEPERHNDYFFPGYGKKPMSTWNIGNNFRKFLWKANISHGGRGKGPRIHDFRHTSAVHCLRRWVLKGMNLRAYLPILQAYLGHSSINDTAYYLHLTSDLYPDITSKIENTFGNIIPEVGDENYAN